MSHQTSPGVERAVASARAWAARRGSTDTRLADFVLGLLDEEEGRPAVLLEKLGHTVATIRQALIDLPEAANPHAPPLRELFNAARHWSLLHRADPEFLTDALLLAVLGVDARFQQAIAACGLDRDRVEATLTRSCDSPTEAATSSAFVPPETALDLGTARVLDANFNRAREALRVLEDYCRFVLDDHFLTGEIKVIRHGLAAVTDQLPPGSLLASRETLRDVGTSISAGTEYDRRSAGQVAEVNLKRLQESLRSLEEYGKVIGPEVGREIEALRYRAYTLERTVVRGAAVRERLADARLYVLLTAAQCPAALDWTIARAAAGGATIFQLREKSYSDRELLARARDVRRWTWAANALFIVNDRPDVARLVEADGVHLGQDDLPVMEARRILGPDALIGVSTHTIEQVRQAVLDGADYLGVGPTFPSRTKHFDQFPGLEFIQAAATETTFPIFALGGIAPENVAQVVRAGASRIAVSAAVAAADDPESAARILRSAIEN